MKKIGNPPLVMHFFNFIILWMWLELGLAMWLEWSLRLSPLGMRLEWGLGMLPQVNTIHYFNIINKKIIHSSLISEKKWINKLSLAMIGSKKAQE